MGKIYFPKGELNSPDYIGKIVDVVVIGERENYGFVELPRKEKEGYLVSVNPTYVTFTRVFVDQIGKYRREGGYKSFPPEKIKEIKAFAEGKTLFFDCPSEKEGWSKLIGGEK